MYYRVFFCPMHRLGVGVLALVFLTVAKAAGTETSDLGVLSLQELLDRGLSVTERGLTGDGLRWQDTLPIFEALMERGDEAVNAIMAHLIEFADEHPEYGDDPGPSMIPVAAELVYARGLVDVLHRMGTEKAVRGLFQLTFQDEFDPVRSRAAGYLGEHVITWRPRDDVINDLYRDLGGEKGAFSAVILSQCVALPSGERAKAVVRRFLERLEEVCQRSGVEDRSAVPASGGQLPPLRGYLTAMGNLGEAVLPFLMDDANSGDDQCPQLWLMLARAMAGDEAMAESAKSLVVTSGEETIRTIAIKAYRRAAGEQAIPFLWQVVIDDPMRQMCQKEGIRGPMCLTSTCQAALGELKALGEFDGNYEDIFLLETK